MKPKAGSDAPLFVSRDSHIASLIALAAIGLLAGRIRPLHLPESPALATHPPKS
jgi:hypothetical protein